LDDLLEFDGRLEGALPFEELLLFDFFDELDDEEDFSGFL
jgi:hypothetical protein